MNRKSTAQRSLEDLLNHLQSQGDLTNRQETESFIIERQGQEEQPLYLKLLAGVGAFMASFFFIGFLFLTEIISFSSEGSLVAFGAIFIGAAIGVYKFAETQQHSYIRHSFIMQLSFTWMALGKTLFVWGVSVVMGSRWGIPVAGLIATLITYYVYKISLDRFLSCFAVLFFTLIALLSFRDSSGAEEVVFYIFFAAQLAGVSFLFTSGSVKRKYTPLAYALACSLCAGALILSTQGPFFNSHREEVMISRLLLNSEAAIAFIALIGWATGDWKKLKTEPFIIASVGIALMAAVSAPGIILSLGFLILGYSKSDYLLIVLGALLLPVFLFFYYYNMDVTLLHKSIILASSGVLLLTGLGYLKFRQWDRRGVL